MTQSPRRRYRSTMLATLVVLSFAGGAAAQSVEFSYPGGLPQFVTPGATATFQVQITGVGGATHAPGTGRMFVALAGEPFAEAPLTDLGTGLYEAMLPAVPACADRLAFYFTADAADGGGTFSDPPDAPGSTFEAVGALGTEIVFEDDFEGDVSAWTVVNSNLSTGAWAAAVPNGTESGGQPAAPDGAASGTRAFVTQNGSSNGSATSADVDGGPTNLISPPIDLTGIDASIAYARWFFSRSGDTDTLEVAVSADGSNWITVETVDGNQNAWTFVSFRVSDFVTPSAMVQVRFRTADSPNDSVTEAAIDLFHVAQLVCDCATIACDDGDFCNGVEQCADGGCLPGDNPCPGQFCDEATDTCVDCLVDADCDDGDFCNGAESCSANSCGAGTDPCPGLFCDEGANACADCLADADCADGDFCNGDETCASGDCVAGGDPCPGGLCAESDDRCVGTVALQERMGEPLAGLTSAQLRRFEAGRDAFEHEFTVAEGLGPIFNDIGCGACHNVPLGGSGTVKATRFGSTAGGVFDPLADLGGSLLQVDAISENCAESVPQQANVTAERLTTPALGAGLVEAIPDADLVFFELNPPALAVSGRAHMVAPLEAPAQLRIGRFGWKSQGPTVLTFSAGATLAESGITNRLQGNEEEPNGDAALLADCDTVPDPEDGPDSQGFHFIDRVTDFQRFLAPPPQTPRSGMSGDAVFNDILCTACHVAAFTTGNSGQLEPALRNRAVRPYSDFLLHNMGDAADFIVQGNAQDRELRTAPLWGIRMRDTLWHDGRVTGGTFDSRIRAAIALHGASGSEAGAATNRFLFLPPAQQTALVAFLDSLGRAEFDHDGDNDVDFDDMNALLACRTGPGIFYTPNSPCSISDVDRDGDVDDDDVENFLVAIDGVSGSVPDGAAFPGTQLRVEPTANGEVALSWGESCSPLDDDYEIYEGAIGDFASHLPKMCSTGGATSATIVPGGESVYYVVVPTNGAREGSHGVNSLGEPRSTGPSPCRPQALGACAP